MKKTVYRTYKFRMYPNAEQRQVLAHYFGSVRFIYNHYLAERMRQYEPMASTKQSVGLDKGFQLFHICDEADGVTIVAVDVAARMERAATEIHTIREAVSIRIRR